MYLFFRTQWMTRIEQILQIRLLMLTKNLRFYKNCFQNKYYFFKTLNKSLKLYIIEMNCFSYYLFYLDVQFFKKMAF